MPLPVREYFLYILEEINVERILQDIQAHPS